MNQKEQEEYEEIPVVLRLKKNIAIVGKLITEYRYNGNFSEFASEEVRQSILTIGPDFPESNKLIKDEEI